MRNEPEAQVPAASRLFAYRVAHAAWASALVGMALYAVTLGGTWIFDDIFHLFNDARTQVEEARPGRPPPEYDRPAIEDPRQWGRYLTESYNDGIDNLYRPVTSLSLAIQATLHGRRDEVAWAWHLVNVLLYGVVCAQVALLAGRLAREERFRGVEDPALRVAQDGLGSSHAQVGDASERGAVWVALCAGLLFATHPVHVEVVAGIVGRAELFCAIGFLGALLVITRPLTPARIAAFVALMFLSIGGKEQGLVLPAVALVWYLSRRWAGLPSLTRRVRLPSVGVAELPGEPEGDTSLSYESRRSGRTDDLGKILLIAVALPLAGYLILREQVLKLSMAWPVNLLDPTIQTMRDAAGLDRWLMPVALAGRYLHLLVWPNRLSIDYGASVIEPPQRLDDPYLWLGVLAILLFVAAAVHALRARWAAGLTLLAGFAVTYGVVSNIATIIGTVFGERLLFLPSAFFVMYVVLLVRRLSDCVAWQRSYRVMRWGLVVVLVLSCLGAVRSFTYAARWNERLAFYEYQARVQPRSVRIWMLLAEELRQRGWLEDSAVAARRATEVEPHYWDGWIIRTMVARDRGRLEEALEYAERAVAERTSIRTTVLRGEIDRLIAQQREAATQPASQPANP